MNFPADPVSSVSKLACESDCVWCVMNESDFYMSMFVELRRRSLAPARRFSGLVALRKEHGAIGNVPPIVLERAGIYMRCDDNDEGVSVLLGNACSEIFAGPALAKVLRAGHAYEARVLAALDAGTAAQPLVQHTAAAITDAWWPFLESLTAHVPQRARAEADWCVNLQVEGASAVHAGVEMLLQLQAARSQSERVGVAVAAASYHGPATTSLGVPFVPMSALTSATKPPQLIYPAPTPWRPLDGAADVQLLQGEWRSFFAEHGPRLGVVVVEPQWGSSCAGACWPPELLREFIGMAHDHGALVLCDEVMCGLGRHALPRGGVGAPSRAHTMDGARDGATPLSVAVAGGGVPSRSFTGNSLYTSSFVRSTSPAAAAAAAAASAAKSAGASPAAVARAAIMAATEAAAATGAAAAADEANAAPAVFCRGGGVASPALASGGGFARSGATPAGGGGAPYCFLADALDLDVDAITFGKAVAAGAYPLSGAILYRGRRELAADGRALTQVHTYAGAHVRALMAATAVLNELSRSDSEGWAQRIRTASLQLDELVMRPAVAAARGALTAHGQGLMRGCLFRPGFLPTHVQLQAAQATLMQSCRVHGVQPYPVAAGGFMCSPPYDVAEEALREGGRRLAGAIEQAAAAGWVLSESSAAADAQARRFVLGTQAQKRAARLAAAVQRREAKPSGEPERGTTTS